MNRLYLFIICATLCAVCSAQTVIKGQRYYEASDFTLVGKLFPDTPIPYHRVDTARFHGFTKGENFQVRSSSGIAVAFRSDSPVISIKTEYGQKTPQERTSHISAWGYDLYVHEGNKWIYAGSGVCEKPDKSDPFNIVKGMDGSMKEFLLYLPTYCEVTSVMIGIREGCTIESVQNPFHRRIGVFGSSYTQGSNTSRGGMTWIAQMSRETGLEMLSLGCGGNCRLQDYFAEVMAAVDCEAYIVDAFSNPTPKEIRERLFPFIETLQAAKPGVPIIFLHPSSTSPDFAATVDGVHPSDYGYYLWMKSIKKPILRILKKY